MANNEHHDEEELDLDDPDVLDEGQNFIPPNEHALQAAQDAWEEDSPPEEAQFWVSVSIAESLIGIEKILREIADI